MPNYQDEYFKNMDAETLMESIREITFDETFAALVLKHFKDNNVQGIGYYTDKHVRLEQKDNAQEYELLRETEDKVDDAESIRRMI